MMSSNRFMPRRNLIFLAILLAASSAAQADVITVTGDNIITLLSSPNLSVSDPTKDTLSVTKTQSNSLGSLGQFDPSLGVLTDATGTLTIVAPANLTRGGVAGSAGFSYQWLLGGNSNSRGISFTTGSSLSLTTPSFGSLSLISSNLNNFVGLGKIGQNVTNTTLSAYKTNTVTGSGPTYAGVSPSPVLATESVAYTYVTHSNASFESGSNDDFLTIDLGQLASGASADQSFSLYDRGGLGLKNFSASYLSGDDVFDVDGVNSFAAGASGSYSAEFDGQSPSALTSYSGIYRLTFTDDVSGLGKYASDSVGTNYVDLTMTASVAAAVPEPETYAMMLAGLGLMGFIARRRKQQDAA
jgi:PEP-CTERM motif-containing protein